MSNDFERYRDGISTYGGGNWGGTTTGGATQQQTYAESRRVRPYKWGGGGYSGIPAQTQYGWSATNLSQLQSAFWSNPKTQRTVMAAVSVAAGYPVKNLQHGAALLNDFGEIAASNPDGPTAWEYILNLTKGIGPDGLPVSTSGGGGGYGGGGGGTTSSVSLTNAETAKQIVNTAMSTLLGRQATDDEFKDFLKSLNEAEMNNPMTVSLQGNVAVQSGGVNAAQQAQDFVTSREDYAEYTAATSLMDAFISALDDPVSL